MQILMVGAGDPPPTFIQRQIRNLRNSGVKVTLLQSAKKSVLQRMLYRAGMPISFPKKVKDMFMAADIIHYQWPSHLIKYISLAKKFKKPVVISLRGRQITVLPHVPGNERYVEQLKKTLPLCDAYHCVSEDIMNEATKYGLDPRRARVIHTAVDTEVFKQQRTKTDTAGNKIKAISVETANWRKGGEYLLTALKRVLDEGHRMELGMIDVDGEEGDRIKYTIKDLGVEKAVRMVNKQNEYGVRDELNNGDIFILSSLSEGISNAAIEAMSCGLPVVTTDCGGMREAVTDGEEGFVVPARDAKKMADAIIKLLNDPDLRFRMGKKAREKVLKEFSSDDQAGQFIDLYNKVLGR